MSTRSWLGSITLSVAVCGTTVLSGCGTNPGDRFVSGGLLGAGTGAAIGAAAGSAGKGALIGGLGGAAIGLLTSPGMLNLGEPPWRHTYYHSAHRSTCTTRTSRSYDETTRTTVCDRVASR